MVRKKFIRTCTTRKQETFMWAKERKVLVLFSINHVTMFLLYARQMLKKAHRKNWIKKFYFFFSMSLRNEIFFYFILKAGKNIDKFFFFTLWCLTFSFMSKNILRWNFYAQKRHICLRLKSEMKNCVKICI